MTRNYLKFSLCTLIVPFSMLCTLAGGLWLWLPFSLLVVGVSLVDTLITPDLEQPKFSQIWLLNTFLYANLPLLLMTNFVLWWSFSPNDLFGFGAWLDQSFGFDVLVRKALTHNWHRLGAFLGLGLIFGTAGTNVAHELVHRAWSPFAQELARWLLAFTWDGQFSVEHVYGHHRKVASFEDPASARRGENFFHFLIRSTVGCNRSAWAIEKQFREKKHKAVWSIHNRLLRAWAISGLYALVSFALLGWYGLFLHAALAIYGKVYLELVNYIEHYGLVRLANAPVMFHHSWNSNARLSSWFLYNLPRHSHHHETAHLPFWRLEPKPEAPTLPFGYMLMILIALIPPLYRYVMAPYLETWDRHWASPDEVALAHTYRANSAQ